MTPNPDQRRAAEPRLSAWVAANAGSGKTAVLTDRVARLLLAGSDPARILCLTYTKAAAAEMQTRLFARLGQWAMLDDGALAEALAALGEPAGALAPPRLARARTLFARALETPGGLKIQTIHAFCDALLRRFPLEAGIAPGFAVLEDRQARALRAAALEALAEADPAPLEALARHLALDDPDPLLTEIATQRARFAAPLDEPGLARALGHAGATAEAVAADILDRDARAVLAGILPAFAAGGPTDAACADKIARALAAPPPGALPLLEEVFLYGATARAPHTAKLGRCPTRATRAALGPLAAPLDALMSRLEDARPRRLAAEAFARARALHAFARAFLAHYEALKGGSLLDFDDLVARAVALLSEPATAAFVLWRLDGGLDHVLVDEAQDTSPVQWRVIRAITDEFFAGAGARILPHDAPRTVFVVGDEKQSIYSFQGADPAAFAAMRGHFEARLEALDAALESCALLHSYRSAAPILSLVDAVFAGPAGARFATPVRHEPADRDRPGRVELRPFLPKPEKPEEPEWDRPLDMPMPDDPTLVLADTLAAEIRTWLDAGRTIPTRSGLRAIAPGDILILVQRRSTVFHPLIRALKRHRVPVAGADVLRIGGELAVRDLLAALRVAATPVDDLTLAALLRSPLCGLTEADLFHLAHARTGALVAALDTSPHAEAAAFVDDLRRHGDFLRPHELLERILIRHDGRRRLTGRLGLEAEDGIDALLDQALAYERTEPPTLTGFLAFMGRGDVTVKRRAHEAGGEAGGEVRVMTVHGAKGLQAPVVILPDTGRRQEGGRRPAILPLADGTPVLAAAAADCPPALAEAEGERRTRLAAENRRLLYVALTRAESWLIVAGAGDPGSEDDASWYATVAASMDRLGAEDRDGTRVLAQAWPDTRSTPPPAPAAPPAPPTWASAAPPRAPEPPRILSPSALGGAHALPGEPAGADPLERGARLHRLLEGLAGQPLAARSTLAARLLPEAPDLPDLLAEAGAVLDAPALAPLFGPGARAEVAIAAPLGPARLLGRIDRLLVEPGRVLAADFKSNRLVPETPEATPEAILRQMGAYAAALMPLYPGRRIETAVVWTRAPALVTLPAALTGAALARALAAPPAP
jgi:ATP-dependent helicase/nuclease subunit A